jgi:aminomethyltransferase
MYMLLPRNRNVAEKPLRRLEMGHRTGLYEAQRSRGGRFIDFNGWDMPVQFAGITAEHQTVRTACGVFDLGHMGRLHLQGPGSLELLSRQVCRRLDDLKPGQVRYGLVLAEDGTAEDDVLVSREGDQAFHVVVNAGNHQKILARWQVLASQLVVKPTLTDLTLTQAMIAIQGPAAAGLLAGMGLDGRHLKYYSFVDLQWSGIPVRLSRTGYTGEDGFECFVPAMAQERFYEAAVAAGAIPCGLGCRDTLRLEAGMPLYGHELDRTVTPVEAGLGFAVNKNGGFVGAEVVLKQLADGPAKKLVGLRMTDKRVPRQGYAVLKDGVAVGAITSGTLSPTLGVPIGMAYVPSALAAVGTALTVDVRGSACAAEVVPLPFYKRAKA